jgi:hypothetical protein
MDATHHTLSFDEYLFGIDYVTQNQFGVLTDPIQGDWHHIVAAYDAGMSVTEAVSYIAEKLDLTLN